MKPVSRSLSPRARQQIAEEAEEVLVSAATLWELAIKQAIGRLRVEADLADFTRRSGFRELPVTFEHAGAVSKLPLHRRDPFDRMLVAQALLEGLTIATADLELEAYAVPVLDVRRG